MRPTPAPVPASELSLTTRRIVVIGRNTRSLRVACALDRPRLKDCRLTLKAGERTLATGHASADTASASATVALPIGRPARRLARRPGGLAARLDASAAQTDGPDLHATIPLLLLPRAVVSAPTDGLLDTGRARLPRNGTRYLRRLRELITGARQISCAGHTNARAAARPTAARARARQGGLQVPHAQHHDPHPRPQPLRQHQSHAIETFGKHRWDVVSPVSPGLATGTGDGHRVASRRVRRRGRSARFGTALAAPARRPAARSLAFTTPRSRPARRSTANNARAIRSVIRSAVLVAGSSGGRSLRRRRARRPRPLAGARCRPQHRTARHRRRSSTRARHTEAIQILATDPGPDRAR
jgi:hypothetical protein